MRYIITIIIMTTSLCANSSDYPQSREERVRDEIGSIAGDEGISFRPFVTKNEETRTSQKHKSSTKHKSKKSSKKSLDKAPPDNSNPEINDYLWDASLFVLKHLPIATEDSKSGIIITDWYTSESDPNYSYKIQVHISDDVISPTALKLSVFEKRMKKGQWYNEPLSDSASHKYEDQILRKAREIYIEKTIAK